MTDHTTVAEEVRKHIGEALAHNPTKNVYIYVVQDEETVLDCEDSGIYPDYTIKKGLCITISSIDCINKYKDIEFPIKFALDNKGFFIRQR